MDPSAEAPEHAEASADAEDGRNEADSVVLEEPRQSEDGGASSSSSSSSSAAISSELNQRNKRLFGSLLGHLSKAKNQLESDKKIIAQKAAREDEALSHAEKAAREAKAAAEAEAREAALKKNRRIAEEMRADVKLATTACERLASSVDAASATFLKTATLPPLFWRPREREVDETPHYREDLRRQRLRVEDEAKARQVDLRAWHERTEVAADRLLTEVPRPAPRSSSHPSKDRPDKAPISLPSRSAVDRPVPPPAPLSGRDAPPIVIRKKSKEGQAESGLLGKRRIELPLRSALQPQPQVSGPSRVHEKQLDHEEAEPVAKRRRVGSESKEEAATVETALEPTSSAAAPQTSASASSSSSSSFSSSSEAVSGGGAGAATATGGTGGAGDGNFLDYGGE